MRRTSHTIQNKQKTKADLAVAGPDPGSASDADHRESVEQNADRGTAGLIPIPVGDHLYCVCLISLI